MSPGEQETILAGLPVAALRLPPETVATLHTLSLRRIGQLLALPRASLPARFGPQLLQRLDQALGRIPEPIVAIRPQPPLTASCVLPAPTADRRLLGSIVGRLIREIVQQVAPRHEGVQRLEVRCEEAAQQATVFVLGTVQPTASAQHLTDLAWTHLEQVQFGGEVLSVQLTAQSISPLPSHQPQLLETVQPLQNRRALGQLADRLRSRLGESCVVQPRLCPDPQPERAVQWQGTIRNPKSEIRTLKRELSDFEFGISDFSTRPLQLLPEPEPIAVACAAGLPLQFTRGQRVHHITACCGPERIETGWWRHADVQRDYYRVDTAEGLRLWVFRRIAERDWFLHGEFE